MMTLSSVRDFPQKKSSKKKKKKGGGNPHLNQNTVSGSNIAGINAETPKVSACKGQH